MRYFDIRLSSLLVLFLSVLLLVGCVTKLENGGSDNDCDTIKDELKSTQAEYDELHLIYTDLNTKYGKLGAEYGELSVAHKDLGTKYDELSLAHKDLNAEYDKLSVAHKDLITKYDELNVKYNAVMQGTSGVSEGDVEQAIFKRINQVRQDGGLNKLAWSDNLYGVAKSHSNYMVRVRRLEYYEGNYWQDVFRAAGYNTLDGIVNATMIIWKESIQYESNFLDEHAKRGAVAVSKSGDIFYITYFADV